MKKLLITGSTGFIGKRLIALLKSLEEFKDYTLVTLSSVPTEGCVFIDHKNHSFSKDDFYKKGIDKIDIVLHLGAFIPKSSKRIKPLNPER